MGLLDLLLQKKTSLDIEVPSSNGGPINVPANNFVQNYLPDNSYLDSTQGKPNNGSELANTLPDTSLDNTDVSSTTSTLPPSPDVITQYTQYNTGEFGEAAGGFTPKWSQDKPYISNYNPTAQTRTINETGLDVEASNAVPTAANPNNETIYPELTRGEFGGSSNQFRQIYTPNSTYLNNINPNTQPQTLNETGLDIENPNASPTTQLPDNYTPYPQYVQGEFNGATSQYVQTYTPSNPYMGNINFISGNETNTQVNSLFSTGLDTESGDAAPTTSIPTTPTEYPSLATGMWGFEPNQFYQNFNQDYTYINNYYNGLQIFTLSQTGLDVELSELSNSSTPTPNSISAATWYPQLVRGVWGGGAVNFVQSWYPNRTYIDNYDSNLLPNTVIDTGLDVEDVPSITGVEPISLIPTPNAVNAPTNYGIISPSTSELFQIKMGVLGGPAVNFSQNWYPSLYYRFIDNLNFYFNPDTNPMIYKLTSDFSTGLDVENFNAAPTTFLNWFLTDPTVYPPLATGRWNGNPNVFYPNFTPSYTYLNSLAVNFYEGNQYYTLNNTGLDVEDSGYNDTVSNPNDVETQYYDNSTYIARGRYNTAAIQYIQQWYPSNYYYDLGNPSNYDKLRVELISPSYISSNGGFPDNGGSGLDLENSDYNILTSDALSETTFYPIGNIDSSQVYWGAFQTPPKQFGHPYKPNSNQYYGDSNYGLLIDLETNPQIVSLSTSSLQIDSNNPFNLYSTALFIPTDPTVYPIINEVNLGEFNGAPSLFSPLGRGNIYTSIKYYLNSVNLTYLRSLTKNAQIKSLSSSSLDISPSGYAFDSVTNYPVIYSDQPLTQVRLGEFGFGPNSFYQYYKPNRSYLTTFNGYNQIESLQYSGLDIENISTDPFLSTFSPPSPDNITIYPIVSTNPNLPPVNLGEFNLGPNPFYQQYNPGNSYLTSLYESIQISALSGSGLDVEETSNEISYTPPIPDTITEYPAQSYVHLDGVANDFYPSIDASLTPSLQYTQRWKPTQTYYSYMKNGEFAPFAA